MKPIRHSLNSRFGRRALLAGIGAPLVLAPFLPTVARSAGDAPKRLVVFFSPHGTVFNQWTPTGSETNFTLGSILSPLAPFQDDIVVVDGLRVDLSGPMGGPHTCGPSWVWTGSQMQESSEFQHSMCCQPHGWNSYPSLDQVVAEAIGADSAFKSLEFGVKTGSYKWPGSRISYGAPAQALDPIDDPVEMFDKLFSSFGLGAEELAKIRARKQSVIDVVKGDLQSLKPKFGANDQKRIEAHLDGVRAIEGQLDNILACTPPDGPASIDPNTNDNFPEISTAHIDLLVAALACDATRVATLQHSVGENSGIVFNWAGAAEGHHSMSHQADGPLVAIHQWYAGQMAYLIGKLKATPEPTDTTKSLLDSTLIVWGSEVGVPQSHGYERMPFVLAGGAGGALQTGRFLTYPGANHCRLFVSIARAMGLDLSTFGSFDDGGGPLPGLVDA